MKDKLARIKSPVRRLLISLLINGLLVLDQVKSPRARAHWIRSAGRPRRLERILFITGVFAALFTFNARGYEVCAILWGSAASIFVIVRSIYKVTTHRKTYSSNWMNSEFQ